ncbi:MAG: methylmalonyl-CoA mutase [Candidatus Dadabacteria bacterium]|nr:MAG: methylmalonyl-CoA mutase [Candidatus Dadabacteria bacterium]
MAKKKVSQERKETFKTVSGLDIAPYYTPDDLPPVEVLKSEIPGQPPYTRGVYQSMYRGRLWTMRQYAGFGTAEETNQRYHYLLKQGVSGLSVAFDLPTQMGRDSDHPMAKGEVGRVGVAISSVEDMRVLLKDIPLDSISISMTINSTAAILLALLIVVAEEQGVATDKLRGTIQNDVLKEYIARGTYIYPPRAALRIVTDIFSFCSKELPKFNTISISGYHIREAGSNAVQELAFTLANGLAYVQAAVDAGLDIDSFAPRLAFFFNCHSDFLEEIAKFRAARRLWAKLIKERYSPADPKSMMLRFHTQTAGSSLTAQQPYNNVVRTTLQALAAVFGGTQSLHTNAYDEALSLPTEESALLALRTQQIIAYESGVADTIDPLAGSYLIENWTDRIEQKAQAVIEHIESIGGMVAAIESGYPQREIENSAYKFQRQIETGERILVGVNRFVEAAEDIPAPAGVDPKSEKKQISRLKQFKAARDSNKIKKVLADLKKIASGNDNLMPTIINCVKSGATVGEISDTLREVFGEYSGDRV